jgi:hypothetical protein
MTKGTRLNARVDARLAEKIVRIRRMTGATTTQVVCDSVNLYYETLAPRLRASQLLEDTGFVGCAKGDQDLSAGYKARLTEILARKSRG